MRRATDGNGCLLQMIAGIAGGEVTHLPLVPSMSSITVCLEMLNAVRSRPHWFLCGDFTLRADQRDALNMPCHTNMSF